MEGGMLWRADVMERSCAVARGKDINSSKLARGLWLIVVCHGSGSED
jgi:hypothetical protein